MQLCPVQLGALHMSHWYVMVIYIVHGGSISANGLNPITDLYASQVACEQTLRTLHPRKSQNALCVPAQAMEVTKASDVQVTQEQWIQSRLNEMLKGTRTP